MSIKIVCAKRVVRPKSRFQKAVAQNEPLRSAEQLQRHVFKTELGWMAALGREGSLVQLVIGCDSPDAATTRLDASWAADAEEGRWCAALAQRLKAYAAGLPASFHDVPVEMQDLTAFQIRVLKCCRQIPRGHTISYGELARLAGRPARRPCRGQRHGRQSLSAGHPLPSRGSCGRPHRSILGAAGIPDETAAAGTRILRRDKTGKIFIRKAGGRSRKENRRRVTRCWRETAPTTQNLSMFCCSLHNDLASLVGLAMVIGPLPARKVDLELL